MFRFTAEPQRDRETWRHRDLRDTYLQLSLLREEITK